MGDLLTKDQLRDSLDRAWKRTWEKRISEHWEKLERQVKGDKENYHEENFEDE